MNCSQKTMQVGPSYNILPDISVVVWLLKGFLSDNSNKTEFETHSQTQNFLATIINKVTTPYVQKIAFSKGKVI